MAKKSGFLYRQGASGQTETVVSSRFAIYSPVATVGNFYRLGVCSTFNINESKNIEAVRGLGFGDQVAELVPGVTQPMTLTIHRTALYLANLMQVLGYNAGVSGAVRSLKHHKWPFDIKTEIIFSELASGDGNMQQATDASVPSESGMNNLGNPELYAIVTVYEGCWLNSYSTNYQIEQAAVAEDCSVEVTDIFDVNGSVYGEFIDSGNGPTSASGGSMLYAGNPNLITGTGLQFP